jgi:hypothetical protein
MRAAVRIRGLAMLAVVLLLLVAATAAGGAAAQRGNEIGACEFKLGFGALRDQIPEVVGACLENERFNVDNGNVEQRTSGGLLVWRRVDNWTAFTDGSTTWLSGPLGLQSRPNGERFAWEAPAGPGPTPIAGPVIPPGAEPLVRLAVAEAAKRAGVDPSAVNVLQVVAREWPDTSLGCPKPDELYAQAITPGYEIVLEAVGQQFSYHTDRARRAELCLQARR